MSPSHRILLTGANGFVGRAVLEALLTRNAFEVTAPVRRLTNAVNRVKFVQIDDIGADSDWHSLLTHLDTVIHLASRVHVTGDSSPDPLEEYRRVNVAGTLALARQAADAGVRRFVFISSIKVNGERTTREHAFSETDPAMPVDPYGKSKAEAEIALLSLAIASGMEVVIIRPPLIYGPGAKGNFQSMTKWLQRRLPIPLGAVDSNRRSFVGLDNLVSFILTCLDHPAAANEVFLVTDGEDLSTIEFFRRTAVAIGVRGRFVSVPIPILTLMGTLLRRRDVVERLCGSLRADISKARRLLGWTPPFTVDEGLRRAVRV